MLAKLQPLLAKLLLLLAKLQLMPAKLLKLLLPLLTLPLLTLLLLLAKLQPLLAKLQLPLAQLLTLLLLLPLPLLPSNFGSRNEKNRPSGRFFYVCLSRDSRLFCREPNVHSRAVAISGQKLAVWHECRWDPPIDHVDLKGCHAFTLHLFW